MVKKKETKKIINMKIEYHFIVWTVLVGGLALWQPIIGLIVGAVMLVVGKLALTSYEMLNIVQEQENK